MTVRRSLSSDILLSYGVSLYTQFAALSESRIARVLAGDSEQSEVSATRERYIVRSPEGGDNDFGILIGHEYPEGLEGDDTSKFMQLVSSKIKPRVIVPPDNKCLMPRTIHETASWVLHLSSQQMETCQALIITSPKEPNFVILLPVHYLRLRKEAWQKRGADFYFTGLRPLWTLHPLPAFPSELTPFVLPFSGVEQAVADMRDYSTGSANQWVNRYTEATFVGVPRLSAFDISVLEPQFPAFRRGLDEIIALFKAFDRQSKSFRVKFCDIRPMLGDFKITHLLTGEDSHVEAKTSHCRVTRVEQTDTLSLQHSQTCLPSPDRALFTWKAQWDYLYTHITFDSGRSQALFVPRDKIPKSWWNVPLSDETVWLTCPTDHSDSFHRYVVNTSTDDLLVHDMEGILSTNQAKAQEPIGVTSVAPATLTETITEPEITQSFFAEERWDSSTFRRGYGSAAHSELRGEMYQVWASEVLLELCRAQ